MPKKLHVCSRLKFPKNELDIKMTEENPSIKLDRSFQMACASVEHASDGIAWISSNAQIVQANRAYCRFFGYRPEEMIGMRIPEFDPNFNEDIWPAHWQALREHKRLIFETQSVCRDGSRVDVEVVANWVVFDGEEFNCAFLRDITQRKQAEHHLHLLQTCVSRLNDIILITEAEPIEGDGPRIVFVNQAFERRTGYSSEEVIGKTPRFLQGEHTSRTELTRIKNALRAWQPIRSQLLNYTKSGQPFWIELDIVPVANSVGWFTHWVAVERDITERMRSDQRKMEFISTVSHELRTPLTSILGSLGLLMGGVLGELPEKPQAMLKLAHENSQRLGRMINDLLDVQKMEAGMMHFDLVPHSLESLLRDAITSNQPFATRHHVQLVIAGEIPEVQVQVDAGRFQQVLANLLSNACKYSHAEHLVTIAAMMTPHKRLRIEIRDTGEGIPEEFRERIFQKFAQADSSDSRAKGGTGLGLAITKEIVQQMHGEIGYQSVLGEGTVFFIELPHHDEQGNSTVV